MTHPQAGHRDLEPGRVHRRDRARTARRPTRSGWRSSTGLHAAIDDADASHAKVIVVSSALPGFFAAGADIKHMSDGRRRVVREPTATALRGAWSGLPAMPADLGGRRRRARPGRRSRAGDGVHAAGRRLPGRGWVCPKSNSA